MAGSSTTVAIKAPVEAVWRVLQASIEDPGSLWPGATAEVLERRAGSLLRRLNLGGVSATERVTGFPARHEIDAVIEDDAALAGQSKLSIEPPLRPGLACRLTVSLDWRSKGGQASPDLAAMVQGAAARAKQAAEPPEAGA
jgi:hypothetical protein